jgi:glycosyltransferase involved in cell wall biosynthesis
MKSTHSPLISICVPTYNRAKYIKQTIDSAINQKFDNFEIIIVDDGSNDETESIVNSYDCKIIKYVQKKHTNAPDTRNRCIQEAKGDYILWLDSDDILSKYALHTYSQFIQLYPDAFVFNCHLQVFSDSNKRIRISGPLDWYDNPQAMLNYFVIGNPLRNPGSLIKKELYTILGNYDTYYKRAHDLEFWSRIALHGKTKCKTLDRVLCYYRIHDSSLTGPLHPITTNFIYEQQIFSKILSTVELQTLFYNFDWTSDYEQAYINSTFQIIHRFLKINGLSHAFKYCTQLLNFKPHDPAILETHKILQERINNFIEQYSIIKKFCSLDNTEITSYLKFLEINLHGILDDTNSITFSRSVGFKILKNHALKHLKAKEYYISLYLHFALYDTSSSKQELISNISSICTILGENYLINKYSHCS